MAKETYVLQCSNDDVNFSVYEYESFGWELVSNNVITTVGADNVSIAAENELTFSREKDTPWYKEVVAIGKEYEKAGDQIVKMLEEEPEVEMKFHWILFIALFFFYGTGFIYGLVFFILKKKKEHDLNQWHQENDPKINEIMQKRADMREKSQNIIDSYSK